MVIIISGIAQGNDFQHMATDRTTIDCVIRPVRRSDNSAVAQIIRRVMTEFNAVGGDYSIADLEVDDMYGAYPAPGAAFFVVECSDTVLGCGGMGPLLEGGPGVCELRKMYFLPELRGASLGTKLLDTILDAAERVAVSGSDIRFLFIGGGAQRRLIEEAAQRRGLANVLFRPYQERESLSLSLGVGDAHLV